MSHVVVVVPASHVREFTAVLKSATDERPGAVTIIPGGAERSESVRCGLVALPADCDAVLVHDAARAFAPIELCDRVLAALEAGAIAVVPALAVTDTIKEVEPAGAQGDLVGAERVVATPQRASLRAVQTPQGFNRAALLEAHASGLDATDDAALIERVGGEVLAIAGEQLAMKVTTPIDIVIAEHLVRENA